jgi:serine/threonine protein kinase
MPMTEGEQKAPARGDAPQLEDPVEDESMRRRALELEQLVDVVLSEREPLGPPVPDPYLGLEVDRRYVIESLIAAGGMGLVYRCRHRVLGKRLAIKIIRSDVAQMPDGSDRFLLEAKAASAIGHEHIVDIGDFGALPDGSPYLVMEYLEGLSLAALLREEPSLGVPRIAHLAIQIAEGLGAAHAAGIVHRDLKPDNVFVLERKGDDFIKILDFGVARMAQSAKRLTQAGTIVGTPHYMSPEQALGHEVDHRGDIYALGVILYELLAGRVPFDGDHYLSVLHQHLQATPPAFSALDPPVSIPAALERIVTKCLAKSPGSRFATMAELARELAPFSERASLGELGELEQRADGAELEALTPWAPRRSSAPPAPRDEVDAGPSTPGGSMARRQPSGLPPPRASGAPGGSAAPGRARSPRPVAPMPTAVLPARSPTLVLPRLTGSFSLQQKRVVTRLSVVVLVVVCAAAAFRLGTTRGRGLGEPAPAREPTPPAAARAPLLKPVPVHSALPDPAASDSAAPQPGASSPPPASPPLPSSPLASPAPASPPPASSSPAASSPPPPGAAPSEPPATLTPGAPSAPPVSPSPVPSAASEPERGKARSRRAPAQPSTASKRAEGARPAPKPRVKDDFMNPWPAPR